MNRKQFTETSFENGREGGGGEYISLLVLDLSPLNKICYTIDLFNI